MKVLILGGTGAMGVPLQKHLMNLGHEVHVTSRTEHENGIVTYHCGNAHDTKFLKDLLRYNFDSVVDFMAYGTEEFRDRAASLCSKTGQYIFISSSRVYSQCDGLITEDYPRLLDVCDDLEYLRTDEYALAKARQENILFDSRHSNWTIVRPSLTYNSHRLQYAIGEKEEWLYRYLHHEKIVFPINMSSVITTLSYGGDVAHAIALLVGNIKAFGEAVHIAGAKPTTWGRVNGIYGKILEERFHRKPKFFLVEDWQHIGKFLGRYYQLKYARSIDRRFDNTKIEKLVGNIPFVSSEEGLKKCLLDFLNGNRQFGEVSCKTEAYYNRITKDRCKINTFNWKNKLKYFVMRYTPYFDVRDLPKLR